MEIGIQQQALATHRVSASLSKPVSAWKVMWTTVVKELWMVRRYLPNLIATLVQLLIRMLFFVILANIISLRGNVHVGRDMTPHDLFIFFQGGLLLLVFKGTALWTPLNTVSRDLANGTLEFLYSNPCSRYAYYVGTVVSDIIVAQAIFIPLFLVLFFLSGADIASMAMVLLVCGAVFFALVAMGVMIALLGLLWRQANAMAGILEISLEMLSGAYFPLIAFPLALKFVAYLLPFTWAYDLIRFYSFKGHWATLAPIWAEWSILGVYAVIYTLLSRFLLVRVERLAKQQGLHLI